MFWPLKGIGCSPFLFKHRQIAVAMSVLPAPLEVPKTMSGVLLRSMFISVIIDTLGI
ncbi:hypothetical protein EW15_1670 [Prochlorococcus sp. MIT 0801]|nr:hypothetical protein EW15_1670 [Prochlorococcus sp. MIT 0801]